MKRRALFVNDHKIHYVGVADTYFLRLRGLIGRNIDEIGGLCIKPCAQIHTFMMGYPIDVIYVSKDNIVLKIDENLPRGKMRPFVKSSRFVVELAAGKAKKFGIKEGDKVIVAK